MSSSASPYQRQESGKKLTRLDPESFVKDYRYAKKYWDEHSQNFQEMIMQLMDEVTMRRVAAEARDLCLRFNDARGLIPKDYNENVIRSAYDRLVSSLTKTHLLNGIAAYFNGLQEFVDSGRSGYGHAVLAEIFESRANRERLLPFVRFAYGSGSAESRALEAVQAKEVFDLEKCFLLFVPQLMNWFARFLEIYDQSLQGSLVRDFIPEIRRREQEEINADPLHPERVLQSMRKQKEVDQKELQDEKERRKAQPQTADPTKQSSGMSGSNDEDDELDEQFDEIIGNIPIFKESFKREKETKELQKRESAKMEVQFLQKSEEKGRLAMGHRWNTTRAEFLTRWKSLGPEKQYLTLAESRHVMLTMAKGSYANALLYCPELNADILGGDGGVRFLDLMEASLRDPAGVPDPFFDQLAQKARAHSLSGEAKDLIRITRRFLKLSYACHVYATVMGIEFSEVSPSESLLAELRENGKISGQAQASLGENAAKPATEQVQYADGSSSTRFKLGDVAPLVRGRKCSAPNCEVRESPDVDKFLVCAACKRADVIVPYCSRECQLYDWKLGNAGHPAICGKPAEARHSTALSK